MVASSGWFIFWYKITRIDLQKPDNKFYVKFIGDNTHAILPEIKIKQFMKEYNKLSKTKMKKLVDSIKDAKEIFDNKSKTNKISSLIGKSDPEKNETEGILEIYFR